MADFTSIPTYTDAMQYDGSNGRAIMAYIGPVATATGGDPLVIQHEDSIIMLNTGDYVEQSRPGTYVGRPQAQFESKWQPV